MLSNWLHCARDLLEQAGLLEPRFQHCLRSASILFVEPVKHHVLWTVGQGKLGSGALSENRRRQSDVGVEKMQSRCLMFLQKAILGCGQPISRHERTSTGAPARCNEAALGLVPTRSWH